MFGAIAGGIASALAGGAMSKLFGGGQKAASGGIQGDVLATDNNTVGMSLVSWIKHSVDRFVIVSIFIPKLRLILILNSFLGSSDSLVFSELFHSLAPRPLAARSIS